MQEITGNLFDYIGKADAICITTNGFVKNNGECVMGKRIMYGVNIGCIMLTTIVIVIF